VFRVQTKGNRVLAKVFLHAGIFYLTIILRDKGLIVNASIHHHDFRTTSNNRVSTLVYSLAQKSLFLHLNRDWTKVSRGCAKAIRAYTKEGQFTPAQQPWVHKRLTVIAQKPFVSTRKLYRGWTKVNRVSTLNAPCLNENESSIISKYWANLGQFSGRMYVSNLISLLTTTKPGSNSINRGYTKGNQSS